MKTNLISFINKFGLIFVLCLGVNQASFGTPLNENTSINSFKEYLDSLETDLRDPDVNMVVDERTSEGIDRGKFNNDPSGASLFNPSSSGSHNGQSCGKITDLSYIGFKFLAGEVICTGGSLDADAKCSKEIFVEINPGNPDYDGFVVGGRPEYNPNGYHYCVNIDVRNKKNGICGTLAARRYPHLKMETKKVKTNDLDSDSSCTCEIATNFADSGAIDSCNVAGLKRLSEKALKTQCSKFKNANINPNAPAIMGTQFMVKNFTENNRDHSRYLVPWDATEAKLASESDDPSKDKNFEKAFYCECAEDTNIKGVKGKYAKHDGGDGFPSCGEKANSNLADVNPDGGATGEPIEPTTDGLTDCLARVEAAAEECKRGALEAKQICGDKIKEAEAPMKETSAIAGGLGNLAIMSQAGSGNQQGCFAASVALSATRSLLSSGKETCTEEVGTCKNFCSKDSFENQMKACLKNNVRIKGEPNSGPTDEKRLSEFTRNGKIEPPSATELYFTKRDEIRSIYNRGIEACEIEKQAAGKSLLDLENILQGVGHALQSALICSCNHSNQSANCAAIPPIDTCSMSATDPNITDIKLQQIAACRPIQENLDTCNPAAEGYNQQRCACMQNPATCTVSSNNKAPDSFFGKSLNVLGQNPATFAANLRAGGGGVNGIGSGNYDLAGGGSSEAAVALNAGASSGYNPKVSGASAGGGGGGGGNGPLNDAKGGPAEEKNGLLSSLFKEIKIGAQSAYNAAKSLASGSRASTKEPRGVDPMSAAQGFRPKGSRNLASDNGPLARANLNIFDIIKLCATGSTCISNSKETAFIKEP